MGQIVYIKAKDTVNLDELNTVLTKMGIKNDFTTTKHNIEWLKDINTNPESHQAHLKPKDRDLTMDELKRYFESYTEIGLLSFDVAFSRTDEETAQKYLEFIRAHKKNIEYLKGATELIERYETSLEDKKVIIMLNRVDPDPVELPKDQQTTDDLQGGLFLCKSWSTKPFWVIFGNVDSPVFLKRRIYEDDMYNNIYRDKQGYAYLMLPLLPLNDKQLDFVMKVYNEAWNMGLREDFNFIIPVIYGLDLTNYFKVAGDYKEFYTAEEIKERFNQLFKATERSFHYNYPGGFTWSDVSKRFKPCGNNTSLMLSKCSIMTCLLWAMGEKAAAELMTSMTGIKYLPFEFSINKLKEA
jgi:hypothetical protein